MDREVAEAAKIAVDYVAAGFWEQGTFGPQKRAKWMEIINADGEDHQSERIASLLAGMAVVVESLVVIVRDGTGMTVDEIFASLKSTFDHASS